MRGKSCYTRHASLHVLIVRSDYAGFANKFHTPAQTRQEGMSLPDTAQEPPGCGTGCRITSHPAGMPKVRVVNRQVALNQTENLYQNRTGHRGVQAGMTKKNGFVEPVVFTLWRSKHDAGTEVGRL